MTIQKSLKGQMNCNRNLKEAIKISTNPEKTFSIALEISRGLKSASLIGLSGELGVGKTVFAKGIAKGLGVKELVTSPTFLGISEYYSGRLPFIHMDFYKKVVTPDTIKHYLDTNSVVLIEWIENFYEVNPSILDIDIEVQINYSNSGKNNREIIIRKYHTL